MYSAALQRYYNEHEHLPYTFIAYVDADYAMKANIYGITEDTVLGHHGVGVFWNIAQWSIA